MATAGKRPCRQVGCPALLDRGGYCEAHKRDEYRRQDRFRGSSSSRGYDRNWRKLRDAYIRAHPLCEIKTNCFAGPVLASEVDHRIPIVDRPDLRLDPANLQSACKACHSSKTMRESVSGIGTNGKS